MRLFALLAALLPVLHANIPGQYVLPSLKDRLRQQIRPRVDPDLARYFQPTDSSGTVLSDIFHGFVPPAAFEVAQGSGAASRGGVGVPPSFVLPNFQTHFPAQPQQPQLPPPRQLRPGEKSTSGIPDVSPDELNLPSFPVSISGIPAFPSPALQPIRPANGANAAPPAHVGPPAFESGPETFDNLPTIPDSPPPPTACQFFPLRCLATKAYIRAGFSWKRGLRER